MRAWWAPSTCSPPPTRRRRTGAAWGGEWGQYNHDATRSRGLSGNADLVVRPGSTAEVAAVMALCYERDVPLIPRGGGTGLAGGAVPLSAGGVVCSLERMRAVRELEPALWRMLPEAGVSTRHVQRIARENGLCFPPDPGASEQSQIGGNVATNAGGPHAFKYGVTGNWVTGLEAVVAPGETITLGGPYRKDVAGYDLKSLLIGSEGTLGIVTAVRLRLMPAPEAALPLIAFHPTRADGCAAILDVLGAGIVPAALDFVDGEALRMAAGAWAGGSGMPLPIDAEFMLLAEVDGTREEARAAHAELAAVLGGSALGLRRPDRAALWEWRDRVPGAVSAMRGGQGERGRGRAGRAARRGARALRGDRRAPRAALVRVGARSRRQRARQPAGGSAQRGRSRRRRGGHRGAVRARGRAGRLDQRRARRGLVQERPARPAVAGGGAATARGDQAGVRSEGAFEPGQEARAVIEEEGPGCATLLVAPGHVAGGGWASIAARAVGEFLSGKRSFRR